jgi:hypothetical protein
MPLRDEVVVSNSAGAPEQVFDLGMQQSNTLPLQSNTPPLRQRPAAPELRMGPYSFPAPPELPLMPDAPVRNVSAENRAQGKEALKAGILGLLLGGGEGATAAISGVRQGMQGRANQDMGERERQFQIQAQRAQREGLVLQRDYMNQLGQVKALMDADDDFNRRQVDVWQGENTLYNNEENRALKDEIAARSNELGLTKAQNTFLLGLAGLGPRQDNAEANKTRAKFYGMDVESRGKDRLADNELAEDKFDFEKIVKNRQLDQTDKRIAISQAHESWMRTNAQIRNGIAQKRLEIAGVGKAGGTGGMSLSVAQQRALEKDLATANLEIEKVRNGAGLKPDPTKYPDEYKLWQSRRLAAEESAAELRRYYNDQASLIGMKFDGVRYERESPKEAQKAGIMLPPITLPDPRQVTTQAMVSSSPTSLFAPPASFAPTSPTAASQGFPSIKMPSRVTVNPAAQSGNRTNPPSKASRAPKTSPAPKPSFLTKEPRSLTQSEKNELAAYLRKKLKG